LTCKCRHK